MMALIHGAVGMASDWDQPMRSVIEQGFSAKAIDLWPYAYGDLSLISVARRLHDELDDCDVLMGYSMGGRIALHMLIDQPERWKKVIIVSGHTGVDNEELKKERVLTDTQWAQRFLKDDWAEVINAWNVQGVLQQAKKNDESSQCGFTFLDRRELEEQRVAVAKSFQHWSVGKQENLLPVLKNISCPVLWITGESDVKFTKVASNAAAHMPRGKHVVAPNTGHRVPWESSRFFADEVVSFLGF